MLAGGCQEYSGGTVKGIRDDYISVTYAIISLPMPESLDTDQDLT
jgi:hypothetical protein